MKKHKEKYKYIGMKCKRCGKFRPSSKGLCQSCYNNLLQQGKLNETA